MPTSSKLLATLRTADPDRYFCTLFAPQAARENLAALYLFNHELARAREVASSGPMALIRLHWWRETVEGAARRHPVAEAVAALALAPAELAALIDAREAEADETIADPPAYLRGTAGHLAWLAGKLLGADCPALIDLGAAYGLAGTLRARAHLIPDPAPYFALADTWLTARVPPALRAAALPAVFARRDLARLRQGRPAPRRLRDKIAVILENQRLARQNT